jgi:hypothetical protein
MALGLLLLLFACYFQSAKSLEAMDRFFSKESRAILVLDNTIERLGARKHYGSKEIKQIFLEEFRKGGFGDNSLIVPKAVIKNDMVKLSVLKANGKAIIEVEVK